MIIEMRLGTITYNHRFFMPFNICQQDLSNLENRDRCYFVNKITILGIGDCIIILKSHSGCFVILNYAYKIRKQCNFNPRKR